MMADALPRSVRTTPFPGPPMRESHQFAGTALLPGLVNTHTHLELTGFAGMAEEADFWEWIKHIIALKATRTDEDFFDAASRGIRACWAAGVTTICDMGNTGSVIAATAMPSVRTASRITRRSTCTPRRPRP